MISIGTIGLIKGIQTFNPSKGARLATYAARCIENEIRMHFRTQKKSAQDVSLSDYIRKDRILDLQIAGAIDITEFKVRNDTCNQQLLQLEAQLAAIAQEQLQAAEKDLDIDEIRKALEKELDFSEGIQSALVATILDKVIVKKESTKEDIHLEIFLKLRQKYAAVYNPKNYPASANPARNTMPKPMSRRI